ncbi:MAG TPA: ester cyclase, partial [Chitinophagaceae bacterium]|nr:ester cyclase [Chitinophagaceae bacterium]
MKKYLIIFSAGLIGLASCSDKKESGGMSETTKKNLEAHHAISKAFETKDFSKIGDYIATDAVDYSGEMGPVRGLDSIKATFERMSAMMTQNKHEILKELADDEYVMSWMKFTGVCNVDMPEMNMKKGQPINTQSIEMSQYKDGKAIAHWTFMEPGEVMKMMGMDKMPPPATDNKTDTT